MKPYILPLKIPPPPPPNQLKLPSSKSQLTSAPHVCCFVHTAEVKRVLLASKKTTACCLTLSFSGLSTSRLRASPLFVWYDYFSCPQLENKHFSNQTSNLAKAVDSIPAYVERPGVARIQPKPLVPERKEASCRPRTQKSVVRSERASSVP